MWGSDLALFTSSCLLLRKLIYLSFLHNCIIILIYYLHNFVLPVVLPYINKEDDDDEAYYMHQILCQSDELCLK